MTENLKILEALTIKLRQDERTIELVLDNMPSFAMIISCEKKLYLPTNKLKKEVP
jgi:hypothetical protein